LSLKWVYLNESLTRPRVSLSTDNNKTVIVRKIIFQLRPQNVYSWKRETNCMRVLFRQVLVNVYQK